MTPWFLAYVASAVFTATVSGVQIHRGCVERNPLAPSRAAANMVFKGATATGLAIGLHLTIKKSPTGGHVLSLTATGMNVAVGVHDALQRCGGPARK